MYIYSIYIYMWEEKVVDGPHLTQDIPMISIETLLDYSNVHIIPHPIVGCTHK